MVSVGLAIDWIRNKYQTWQDNGATFGVVGDWVKMKLELVRQKDGGRGRDEEKLI
jgi:hypothetical protein